MAHQCLRAGFQGRRGGPRGSAPPPVPLRQVEASEFTALVPFDDKNGEPLEAPAVLHGLPTLYYYYGQTLYLWSAPLHAWRLKVDYAPREETRSRNASALCRSWRLPD